MNDQHWNGYDEARGYGGGGVMLASQRRTSGPDSYHDAPSARAGPPRDANGSSLSSRNDRYTNDSSFGRLSNFDVDSSRAGGDRHHLHDSFNNSRNSLYESQSVYSRGGRGDRQYSDAYNSSRSHSYEAAYPNEEYDLSRELAEEDSKWGVPDPPPPPPPMHHSSTGYRNQMPPEHHQMRNHGYPPARDNGYAAQRFPSERGGALGSRESSLRPSQRLSSDYGTGSISGAALRTQRLPSEKEAAAYGSSPGAYSSSPGAYSSLMYRPREASQQSFRSSGSSVVSSASRTHQHRPPAHNMGGAHYYGGSTRTVESNGSVSSYRNERRLPSQHMAAQREASMRRLRRAGSARSLGSGSYGGSSCGSRNSRETPHKKVPPRKLIEVMPGQQVPLRGANETWSCVENDFFLPVSCMGCSLDICCIQDADFVICPCCRVVSPLEGMGSAVGGVGGAGLGFTFDDLAQWQADILRRRERRP